MPAVAGPRAGRSRSPVLKWLMAKEERFQELFAKNTANLVAAAKVFSAIAVKWAVAGRIVWAWVITIPISALVATLSFWVIDWIW